MGRTAEGRDGGGRQALGPVDDGGTLSLSHGWLRGSGGAVGVAGDDVAGVLAVVMPRRLVAVSVARRGPGGRRRRGRRLGGRGRVVTHGSLLIPKGMFATVGFGGKKVGEWCLWESFSYSDDDAGILKSPTGSDQGAQGISYALRPLLCAN